MTILENCFVYGGRSDGTGKGIDNGGLIKGTITTAVIAQQRQETLRQLCHRNKLRGATLKVAVRQNVACDAWT